MSTGPELSHRRRLDAGAVVRNGSVASYRGVAEFGGEPHTIRQDLIGGAAPAALPPRGEALACFCQITDLHVTDVQSPARFEFVNREYRDPRFRELLPMQRPQEALNVHALAAMLRAIDGIGSGPVTGTRLERAIMSGDAIDSAQWNELATFMALFDGGMVKPDTGGPGYEGVQSSDWPDDTFWKPDGGAEGDLFRLEYGYPLVPGLLEGSMRPFHFSGLSLPWLGCHGNHEELSQGVGIVTPELAAAMVGTHKPLRLPEDFDSEIALETFVRVPEAYMAGPGVKVTADPARRPITRRDFIEAHLHADARPAGHGFTPENLRDGTAYYVYDTPEVRYITLDTACPMGGAEGSLGWDQLRWLERRLEEVHSSFTSADGTKVRTANEDRLVVIVSHHGPDTLTNRRVDPGPDPSRYARPRDLIDALLRFDNVVLWLNGHIHHNRVRAHPSVGPGGGGFWEVTTGSLVDWPCQARVVEIYDAGEGLLAIACTMVDHDGPAEPPAAAYGSADLAGLHRQLAGNVPVAGFDSGRAGTPLDRNVILPVRAPFPVAGSRSK